MNLPISLFIKDKTTTNHWVGYSLIKTIDIDEFFKIRVIINELDASLNDSDSINGSGIKRGQTEP